MTQSSSARFELDAIRKRSLKQRSADPDGG